MKKMICVFLALSMIPVLAGCGGKESIKSQPSSANSVNSVIQQQIEQVDAEPKTEEAKSTPPETAPKKESGTVSAEVDVDLTKLSSTMVYSEVFAMLNEPTEYLGKTIRMNGQFSVFQGTNEDGTPNPEQLYFACVIADATACCQQGLEFILAGGADYPEDYPEPGTDITVVGEFQTYMEGPYLYCHLINAEIE